MKRNIEISLKLEGSEKKYIFGIDVTWNTRREEMDFSRNKTGKMGMTSKVETGLGMMSQFGEIRTGRTKNQGPG